MKYSIHLILIVVVAISCSKEKEIVSGTSLALAIERKNTISNIEYDLFFNIPRIKSDSIPANSVIRFDLKNSSGLLQIDFSAPPGNIKHIDVNDRDIKIEIENDHVLIDDKYLKDGANEIKFIFIAGEKALNRNSDYLYSLFVPSRAATCFPVFDQPDLKAIYKLKLSVPDDWHAVSNGKVLSIDSADDRKTYTFNATKPTSTYQFAFTAGKFFKASDATKTMTIYYRETDSIKVKRNLSEIFELHRKSLEWLKEYTLIDYPYEKFEFVLMPAFQFGGMEHPGNIFYRERSLFLDSSASVNEQLGRAGLIAHETAHMWFGNLVTMKWFNDVWLKEVFANFMAAKIVSPDFPQINHQLRFLMAHYPAAYAIDRSHGAHPIQQPLDNLNNAGSVYGAIIYQKAPIMMRNLESLMGEKKFKEGIQEYLKTYSYNNATWDDLVTVLNKHSNEDLSVWNKAWIKTKGMPEISSQYSVDRKSIEVKVINDSAATIWPQFFTYKFRDSEKELVKEIKIEKGKADLIPNINTEDYKVIPNYSGRGYGYFHADHKSIEYMLESVSTITDPEIRAGIWMNLWEYMLHDELHPKTILHKMLVTVEVEKDPLLMDYITDKVRTIFWQFLSTSDRNLVSNDIEKTLLGRIDKEKDNSLKRTLFNCYRSVAISPEGIVTLKKLWNDEITFVLILSERDHIQLAYDLALRQAEGYDEILKKQLERITNPDRKNEMEFLLPSLSGDVAIRDSFFESLKEKQNRVHEPWTLEALRFLNHPLRSKQSIKYIKPSLELLEEIQKTGDIFFPKGWLDATLLDYQSKKAADIVRVYLKENTSLRNDLKNKLLQSSDMLFRAEKIVKNDKVDAER